MVLLRYTVERYRCFVDPTSVDVRPLTLLFGRNAAGKSALARALPLLARSAASPGVLPLALDHPSARGATYRDVASRLSERNALVFSMAWQAEPVSQLTLQLRDMPEQHRHIVEDLQATLGGTQLRLRFEEPGDAEDIYEVTWRARSKRVALAFTGLRPLARQAAGEMGSVIGKVRSQLEAFARNVHWLTAVRAPIERVSPPGRGDAIESDGKGVEQVLASDSRGRRTLLDFINRYYVKMFDHTIGVDSRADGDSLVLTPNGNPLLRVALADTGEGASQVLAVLAFGAQAHAGRLGRSPVLVLEQPEVHLHPGAERALAQCLTDLAAAGKARLVVETHSENLLLFTLLAVAEGALDASDLAIYFVRERDRGQGSVADRIEIPAIGRPKNWPPGVFSEDIQLARELLGAQRRRAGRT